MDEITKIQLGSSKSINMINVDENVNIELLSSTKQILSYNESSVIDVSNLFAAERQESESYRVYGSINYLSVLNGLYTGYTGVTDFFKQPKIGAELSGITKNLINSFDVYLTYPSTGKTYISGTTYIREHVIVTKLENIEIYKAGFSKNIFNNIIFAFDFNVDFDIEELVDSFGKPINRFYLFFKYKPTTNGLGHYETLSGSSFSFGSYSGKTGITATTYTIDDIIAGDLVSYVNTNFEEEVLERMTYYITTPYSNNVDRLQFKYNPFIEIKVRDFDDEIVSGNISGGTETDLQIPYYAIKIDDEGNYIWKEILVNGYIDPITGKGVDYPFVNKRHYIFSNIVLTVKPDLSDENTESVFSEIKFGNNIKQYTKPSTDLNDLGDKCA